MRVEELNYTGINLTVVFPHLNLDLIQRATIREAFREQEVIITDVPDTVIVIAPQSNVNASYNQQRLIINIPMSSNGIEWASGILAEIAPELIKASGNSEIIAYGFNVDGEFKSPENIVNEYFLDAYGGDSLSSRLGARLVAVAPNFGIVIDGILFNIALQPVPDKKDHCLFHCNMHLVAKDLPSFDLLKDEINKCLTVFNSLLERL